MFSKRSLVQDGAAWGDTRSQITLTRVTIGDAVLVRRSTLRRLYMRTDSCIEQEEAVDECAFDMLTDFLVAYRLCSTSRTCSRSGLDVGVEAQIYGPRLDLLF